MLVRIWRKVNSLSQVGRQTYTTNVEISVAVPRKLGVDLTQNLAILIKGIYPKDFPSYYRDTCSSTFIAVLLITISTRKLSRCTSTDEWTVKM